MTKYKGLDTVKIEINFFIQFWKLISTRLNEPIGVSSDEDLWCFTTWPMASWGRDILYRRYKANKSQSSALLIL